MAGRGEQRAYRRRLAKEERLAIRAGGPRARAFAGFGEGSIVEGPQLRLVGEHAMRIGTGVTILKYACLEAYAPPGAVALEIGSGCYLSHNLRLVALNGIQIGDHTAMGQFVTCTDTIHDYKRQDDEAVSWQAPLKEGRPLRIGSRVWIGVGTVVVGGITIGDGAIIGPNAVISRDVPAGVMVQGNPAHIVKRRGPDGEWEPLAEPVLLS